VAKNIPGGTKLTITVTFAGSSNHTVYLAALEYSGADPVNPVNATKVATGAVSANGAPATGNLTTTIANAKLVATSQDSNESYTSTGNGAGYTTETSAAAPSISGGTGWPNLTEDKTAATPGTWNATAGSAPGVNDWVIQLVALAPATAQTVAAGTDGTYIFNAVNNGTYTITPSKSNTTFTPVNQSPTVNGANVTGVNFAAAGFTGTISGTVTNSTGTAIAGATISYNGGTTTSATDGTYTLSNVPAGSVSVTAAASGYQSSTKSVTVTANTTTTQNFTLSATVGTISGTVTNTSGAALSGASVAYSGGSTTTGANGSYTLANVPTGSVSVTVSATGYQSSTQSVPVTANTTTTQNFTLSATVGTISGTVTNTSGAAISGATVAYSGGSTTTGTNGSYTLANVPVGSVSVTVTATGYQSSTQSVPVTANTTTTQNFTLSTTVGTISGTVTNTSGAAISGATVSYSGGSTISASNGTYSLASVPTGTVSLTATATGYQSFTKSVTVTANTTTTQNFTLTATVGTISGTVTNSGGAAISGATVAYSGGSTATASNGSYTLSNVATGTVSVTASAGGYTSSTQSVIVTANTTTTANFTLAAVITVGTISGTVTNSSGTAISGATVSYSGGTASTGSNGSYTLANVPAGTVSVTASATGYQSSTLSVNVTAGVTTTQNFTLTATVTAGTISGTVTNSSGNAISGATVSYTGGTASTDSNGSYTLANVPTGTVSVTATATGYQSITQSVAVTANATTTQNFTLSPSSGQTYSVSGTLSPASNGSGASVILSKAVPVLVQSAPGAANSGASSATVSFGAVSAAGDTILLFARFGGTISSVTDNQSGGSNSYTSVLGPTTWGVSPDPTDRKAQVFVAKNITGGTKLTIKVSFTGTSNHTVYLAAVEYSGVDPVNPVNATAVGTGKGGTPKTANLTTTTANAVLLATSQDSNESYTSSENGSGFTTDTAASMASITGGKGWPSLTEYKTAAIPGVWNATTTSSSSIVDWVIQVVALAPAGSQTTTADSNGNFIFSTVGNGTYTVTPTKSGHTFTPPSQSVTVSGGNVAGITFTAN
jgi:hypothetical protein